jgi:hypothetical protein
MDWSLLRNLKLLCRPAFWVLQEWDCWLLSLPPCGHRPELLSHQYCCTHIRKALSNSGTSGRVYNVVAVRLHCGFWIFMKMNCWVITGWVMLWGRSIGRMWQMQWNSNVSSHISLSEIFVSLESVFIQSCKISKLHTLWQKACCISIFKVGLEVVMQP